MAWDHGVLGALGFGAAAWKVAARDRWTGWERPAREAHLGSVLNNARFLIRLWVQVRMVAGLGGFLGRKSDDFPGRKPSGSDSNAPPTSSWRWQPNAASEWVDKGNSQVAKLSPTPSMNWE